MNLTKLSDDQLLMETKSLVRREREILMSVLHHLREIERRRLYGEHSSLFVYAIKELGYSEAQAGRRISAMRLLRELPELEANIKDGEINLTHIGLAQSLFHNEKKNGTPLSTDEKIEVFEALKKQTTREAERTVQSFATVPAPVRETIRPLGDGRNLVTMEMSDELLAKMAKLKGLLAHEAPYLTYAVLLDRLCDLALERWDPAREPDRRTNPNSNAAIRRQVWKRDGGVCVWCGNDHAVEIDHVKPKAAGGEDTLENMRLLCRSCNERAAVEFYGQVKMDPYLSRERPRGMARQKGAEYRADGPSRRNSPPAGAGTRGSSAPPKFRMRVGRRRPGGQTRPSATTR